ncbi:hypothetical protein J1F21_08840 [Aeromonas veronii]|uniref:hypothetical protein n=1 Tax=Aeromonas veronii TaxID=654 RepID=UPI001A8D4135|nr:hypothetical protein [Aeromonas veronii]MBO0398411.1 hypothetical protein [Aeromonas veronii]
MNRGLFSSISNNEAYSDADKKWTVELQRFHKYWYDLVVNPNEVAEYFDTRKLIVDYLKGVKKDVEQSLEKRFVYFICSRTKVRFNTKKKPFFNPITKKVKIHILVGKKEAKRSIRCKFFDRGLGKFTNPRIDLTDKYITITDSSGDLTTASIHDFLDGSNINLGISSNVEYVGYTENPHARPTNGSHTGLSDTLYKVSNEDCDTLIYFNIFKVITEATSKSSMLNFVIPNSMTDEIGSELEGKVIEKCFIFYFDAINQSRNKKTELSELKNSLVKMAKENKIGSITFYYEFEHVNDYAIFSSSSVEPNYCHRFSVFLENNHVEVKRF